MCSLDLKQAIKAIFRGLFVSVPELWPELWKEKVSLTPTERNPDPAAHRSLTPREIEVHEQLAKGRSNQEIASALGIETRTVEVHIARIFIKLGVKNRTQAAMLSIGRQEIIRRHAV